MKTHSKQQLETFRIIGSKLFVRDNIEEVKTETDDGHIEISYRADEYILPTDPSFDDFPNETLSKLWERNIMSVSRRKFKIGEALYQVNGTPLVELIEALLAGLPEPTKTVATISYKQSGSFDRLDPFILQFSQALGMSEEEVDEFFRYCLDEGWDQ